MTDTRLYFAYGSNINLEQMAYRCPDAQVIGPVTLEDYELTFRGRTDGRGVANIEPKEGSVVHGLLWRITPKCEIALDRYEGVPRLYVQQEVTVRDANDKPYTVMAYVMTELFREPALPSQYYFDGIRDGFIQNGMDDTPLLEALTKCHAEVSAKHAQYPPYADVSAEHAQRPPYRKEKRGKQHER